MATKTPTKPKRKQTQTRSWENLTDRRKLRHIENTLDKAIAQSLANCSIQSHADFKAYVEDYSRESGKAPITVELCVGGGDDEEIKGYRFYLTSDPSHRTSGKYLIKNLEGITNKDENYFTPSNIAEICGFAETELDDLGDELEDDLLDLDDENEEINEIDDLLTDDFNNQLDDLDDLEEEEELSQSRVSVAQTQAKTPTKNQNKSQTKTQTKTQDQPQTNKATTKKSKFRAPIDEASRLSATAATNGREVNGVNLAGLAGQLGTLGIAVGQGVLEQLAAEADEKRLKRILKELQKQNDRVDNLTSRLEEINPNSSEFINTSNTFSCAKSSNTQNFQDYSTTESSKPDHPLAAATINIGSKVDKLGSQLNPNYQSQPFELDKDASITEQLKQIEDYLQIISKRLDNLEILVSQLEQQMAAQQNSSVVEPKATEESVLPQSPNQPDTNVIGHLKKRQFQQQQIACADALVGFAKVASELFDQSPEDGIAISKNKTLRVKQQSKQTGISADVAVALENNQSETLFAGTRTQGQWTIFEDNLTADEKTGICKLPQSKEEYALKASAQELIQKLQTQLPQKFNGNDEPTFTWAENGKAKYDFEIVKLTNGTQLLQGFNPKRDNEQVLDAVLAPDQPPEIRYCSIPLQEMEALLDSQQSTRSNQAGKNNTKQRQQQAQTKANKSELQV
ncbi:hypothetical protein B6N60_04883 [Richelia sinica FACHB-800]|uniref:Uncharacterized protein n=1 Tax=Richelia sinica FACHB-800 TaxID=1357546 RepID=A0A975TCG5_9NOST|nr:hypothetical protein [Richelia sinica]MBD2666219.1 hypothetical protein [Richelia sinica FACHB-800]QXE26152.1 hypothetical protein B6N60_04883 [Richelia sinica FACHB-800]